MPAASPTINLNSDTPAAPANGINVQFTEQNSVRLAGQVNVTAALVGDGNTGHFLRGDGTFANLPAGSGHYPPGANFRVLPRLKTSATGWANYSFILKVPACCVAAFTTGFQLVTRHISGTFKVASAVLRYTKPEDSTWQGSPIAITWSGVSNPSLSAGFNTSDAIGASLDASHDWYFIVHADATMSGTVSVAGTPDVGTTDYDTTCGYILGDQTASADATTFNSLNAELYFISQVLTA